MTCAFHPRKNWPGGSSRVESVRSALPPSRSLSLSLFRGPPCFASCVALLKFEALELKLFFCSQKKQWGVKYHFAFRSLALPPVWSCQAIPRHDATPLKAAKFRNFVHNTSAKSLRFSCEERWPAIRRGHGTAQHSAVFVVSTNVLSVHLAKWEIAQYVCTHIVVCLSMCLSSHVITMFTVHVKGCTS